MSDNTDEEVTKIIDDEPDVYEEDNNVIDFEKNDDDESEDKTDYYEMNEMVEEPEEKVIAEKESKEEPEEKVIAEKESKEEPEEKVIAEKESKEDLEEAMEEIREIREESNNEASISDKHNFQVDPDFDICIFDFIKQVDNKELEYFFKLKINSINKDKIIDQIKSFRSTLVDEMYDTIQTSLKEHAIKKRVGKKDIAKVDERIYNRNNSIVSYLYNISMLMLLTNNTYTLQQNKNMMYNISNDMLLNYDIKRFISDLTKKKGAKRVIKEYEQELKINTNIICLSLIVALFNIIKKANVSAPDIEYSYSNLKRIKKLLEECSEQSEGEKVIYIEDDEIFFFDDQVLLQSFKNGDYINRYNNKKFDEEFIKHITTKVGKCQTCGVDITDDKYKSIYMARDKPMLVHFCSLECFTDIKWKQADFLDK